ncbi:MAG: alpha-glucosidase [Flavobacteriales bacterium]|nr:alpha-glucosidase [Flavobacteriales bacterium]MCB9204208.1 alpha-glucosidase [Flavobacteriales bacterium]
MRLGHWWRFILFLAVLAGAQRSNAQDELWWKSTTVYQIYPRSFYDTDGDGLGDLNGIIQKLDHIQALGFETIWISPFFKSPQRDFGYDISDYQSIAPEYGDKQTCLKLIEAIHKRDMKIVFDLVMNHTSDEHAWFKESASSKDNPKADWYVWKDGKGKNGRKPPNNWKATIGGSGWHWHEGRQQFYWASFLDFQPDLNYSNPEVKQAMLDVARFWLSKGVDGFRLDIFNSIFEDTAFTNNPASLKIVPSEESPDGFFQKMKYNVNQEESFRFATELRAVVDSFQNPERFMVGEVFGDVETIKKFTSFENKDGLHTIFLFQTLSTPFKAKKWRKMVEHFEGNFPAPFVPTYVFSNHDRRRSITPLGNDVRKAKLLALFQFSVRGIPFTYYGEELGIEKPKLPLKTGKDPLAQRYKAIPQFMVDWTGQSLNRDECRTPMLWDTTAHAGFTSGEPWLPVAENLREKAVSVQEEDEESLMNFYRKMIRLRNENEVLQMGVLTVDEGFSSAKIFAFSREMKGQKLLVLMNFSKRNQKVESVSGENLISTYMDFSKTELKPFEGRIIRLQ